MENSKYTAEQLVQTGAEIVEVLLALGKTNNNLSGDIKDYLNVVTSDTGRYEAHAHMMNRFTEKNRQIHDVVLSNTHSSAEQIQNICTNFKGIDESIQKMQESHVGLDKAVNGLNEKVKEISNFIKDIQDVSEQTRLLSFNASIEAARAGVAGRGFRVIANEVQLLSDRTTSLSNSIDAKIREVQETVKEFLASNEADNITVSQLQQVAAGSQQQLEKITEDFRTNATTNEQLLEGMASDLDTLQQASESTQKQDIQHVQEMANHAATHTIQVGDQFSFLFELRALFNYLSQHRELFADYDGASRPVS